MANAVDEVRAIEREEVEFRDTPVNEVQHLLRSKRRSRKTMGLGIIFQSLETAHQPARDYYSTTRSDRRDLLEIMDGKNARNDRHLHSACSCPLFKSEKQLIVEKELRDDPIRARINFILQSGNISRNSARCRVLFWVTGNRDLKVCNAFQVGHHIAGVLIVIRPWLITIACGYVSLKSDHLSNAKFRIRSCGFSNLGTSVPNAGEMNRWRKGCFTKNSLNGHASAFSRKFTGARSYRDARRPQRTEPINRTP